MGYKRATETMKKLASALSVLALLATMTFGFSSCQQQNQPEQPKSGETTQTDPTKTEEPSLVGEWKVLYMNLDGDQYPGQGMSFTFLENGTFLLSMEDGLYKGSYTLAGKNLIMETEGEGGIGKFTIKELTKDSLVLISGDGSIEYVCKRVS